MTDFLIPEPVGHALGRLPSYPGALMLVTALNLTLARHLTYEVAQKLHQKKLRLCVTDAHWAFDFEWREHWFVPCLPHSEPDLTISANLCDFARLAQRKEDPDTLFFNRRLTMEGDTELGLLVKNTIDAIEFPSVDQFKPSALWAKLCERIDATLAHVRPR